jgi:hypothetical protein
VKKNVSDSAQQIVREKSRGKNCASHVLENIAGKSPRKLDGKGEWETKKGKENLVPSFLRFFPALFCPLQDALV